MPEKQRTKKSFKSQEIPSNIFVSLLACYYKRMEINIAAIPG